MAPLSQVEEEDCCSHRSLLTDNNEDSSRPRKVSFAVDVAIHEIEQLSDYSEEAMKDAWFQDYEYNSIDNVNTELVLSFQKDGMDSSGHRSYHTTDVEVVYSSCLDSKDGPSQDDLDRLDAWVRNCNLLRGLESDSLPGLANKRRKRREAVIRSVIHLQSKISAVLYSVYERAEMIRDASEKLSQPSKEFARFMGLADQSAAKDELRRPEAKRMQRSWRSLRSCLSGRSITSASSAPPTSACPPPPPSLKRGASFKNNLMERLGFRRSRPSFRWKNLIVRIRQQ